MAHMQYRLLGRTGLRVSIIGFGASPFGNVFQSVELAQCQQAVDAAIEGGINFFDVSPYYGHTLAEERLGETLYGKRDSVYLATKCGRYGAADFDFSKKRLLKSIDESLQRLKTDYVDLLQAHDIEFGNARQIIEETIPALLEIKAKGKARFVGITGYQLRMLAKLAADDRVDTVLSYCRSNLLVEDMDTLLLPTVEQLHLGLINASPLHMGLLAPSQPPAWHPAPDKMRQAARAIVALCEQHGVSASQVALQRCLQHPYAATTLVGMSTADQVHSNLHALQLELDPALSQKIEALAEPVKNVVWPSGLPENADYLLHANTASLPS